MDIVVRITTEKGQYSFAQTKQKDTDPEALNQQEYPEWAKLECKKCPHCPLGSNVRWCPAAASMNEAALVFEDLISYDEVQLEFEHDEITFTEKTHASKALTTLLMTKLAFCACPVIQVDHWSWKYFSPKITINNFLFRRLAIRLICEHVSETQNKQFSYYLNDDYKMLHQAKELKHEAFNNAMCTLDILLQANDKFIDNLYNELKSVLRKVE